MNGMTNMQDLCTLQVNGINQLAKEIEELKDMKVKYIDNEGLHRNEQTNEIEG